MRNACLLLLTVTSLFLSGCANATKTAQVDAIQISKAAANAAEPAIAALPNGDVAVAWVEHREKGADVFLKIFGGDGQAKGDAVRVNLTAGEAKAWRGDPPTVRATSDGTIFVGWTAAIPNEQGTTLYVSASRDGGRSFEAPVKVNDDAAPASHGMHSLAVDDAGGVYVLWLDERYMAGHVEPEMHHGSTAAEPNAELYFASSTDGGRTFSPNRRVAGDVCPCCKSAIAGPTKGGKLFVGWRQVLPGGFRHISVAMSNDKGATFEKPLVVADDKWKIDACPVSGPSLFFKDGALEVAWFAGGDARPHGVYWSHLHADDADEGFSEPLLVGEAISPGTPVLIGDGVVWSDADVLKTADVDEHTAKPVVNTGPGSVPAAAFSNGRTYIAFVRKDGDRGAIWLAFR